MKKLGIKSYIVLVLLTAIIVSFQNCSRIAFDTMEPIVAKAGVEEPAIDDGDSTPQPPQVELDCKDFASQKGLVNVILVVDNSLAADQADPAKLYRRAILRDLVTSYKDKANFTWSVVDFNDNQARGLINDGDVSNPKFGRAEDALAAIQNFVASPAQGSSAPYQPVFNLVEKTILAHFDIQGDARGTNYVVVFVAAAPPSDFARLSELSNLQASVSRLSGLLPSYITLSTINVGSVVDPTVTTISTELALQKMAQLGRGSYANASSLSAILDTSAGRALLRLDDVARVPASICVDPTNPNPSPSPGKNACAVDERTLFGADEKKMVACGLDGKKEVISAVKIMEACTSDNEGVIKWTETSRTNIVKSEGACMGQSCRLPNGDILKDKESKTLYSSMNPTTSCVDASQSRTCNNGVLSGSNTYKELSCKNGCGDFGANGTVKTNILVGQTKVDVVCPFGETGVKDTFESLLDRTCSDGRVVDSNSRNGKLLDKGLCPTYKWTATSDYSVCSANCGGEQTRKFECRDDKGALADANRCVGSAPVEKRVCDGNVAAAARSESVTVDQSGGSTTLTCPKDQIGVVVEVWKQTTTKNFACIDHKVELASTVVTNSDRVKESYCRDYVAHRCSQDSLSVGEANARYQWMVKCQDSVPLIKDFLTQFKDVKVSGGYTITNTARPLYPTFMNTATNPEKAWIAPKVATAACTVPATAYVAGVCLSSCATPEQEIMIQAEANAKLKYSPFADALNGKAQFVGTLQSSSTMSSKDVVKTKVDQWVTEMIDSNHDIVEFKMKSGQALRLTPNHPVLTAEGAMKLAGDFKVGENLVKLGGELDPIVKISSVKYFGKVYNVFVQSAAPQNNIVVTNGYLNGTAFFQNEGASEMNRLILRKNLTSGALPK